MQALLKYLIIFKETYFWGMIQQLKPIIHWFKVIWLLIMAIRFSALLLAIPIPLLFFNGDSKASIKQLLTEGSPYYFKALSNISTLMATEMDNF